MADARPRADDDWIAKEFEAKQYFTPATPVDEYALFAGRSAQVHALIDAVAERGRHAVLYGERGVGKTSLANTFYAVLGSASASIKRIRVQCDPSDDFSSIWKKIFREIRVTAETPDGQTESVTLDQSYDGAILPDDVRRELASVFNGNMLPIVVIDEFDGVRDKDTLGLMANAIKYLSDYSVNVTLVVVGVADSVSELMGEHESIKRCITQVHMPRMSEQEMREIIDKRLPRLGMRIAGDAKWKIIALSRGVPSYVHALTRFAAVRSIRSKRLNIAEADVDEAINDLLDQTDLSCREDYQRAVHSNQSGALYRHVLLACALAQTKATDGFFSPSNVVEPLAAVLDRPVEIATFQQHLAAFSGEERGRILQRRGRPRAYQFRFRDPMMQPYVIMRGIKDGMVSEKAKGVLSFPEQPGLFPND